MYVEPTEMKILDLNWRVHGEIGDGNCMYNGVLRQCAEAGMTESLEITKENYAAAGRRHLRQDEAMYQELCNFQASCKTPLERAAKIIAGDYGCAVDMVICRNS